MANQMTASTSLQALDAATLQEFRRRLRGETLAPGDLGYDEARPSATD